MISPFSSFISLIILLAIERGWTKFPSTLNSSMGLTFGNAFLLVGTYYGSPTGLGNSRLKLELELEKETNRGGVKEKVL